MKKKGLLILGLFIFGIVVWYLFFKPYDYLVTFKANTLPGTINQSVKLWSKSLDPTSKVVHNSIENLSQKLTINDSTYVYNWKIQPLSDSTSSVKIYVRDLDHSLTNKIKILFGESNFEKTTKRTLLDFNNKLNEHLKRFRVTINGKDTLPSTYYAYVSIKSTQFQKAKGMMQNYSFLNSFTAENKLKLNGRPMVEITWWDVQSDSIHYNFCYPIVKTDTLPEHKLIKYKQIDAKPALKATYNGNYITSDRAWYALLDYAKEKKIEVTPTPIEVFHNNPNFGGNELIWKAEIYMPIQ